MGRVIRRNIRSFLLRIYLTLFLVIFVASILYCTITIRNQIEANREWVGQKVAKVIEFNKNELLDEIALKDYDSLKQHLNILRGELDIDWIELVSQGVVLYSDFKSTQVRKLESSFMGYQIPPLQKDIANDYGGFQAVLKFHYAHTLIRETAVPILKRVFSNIVLVLALLGVIFFITFHQIRKNLINPLHEAIALFKSPANTKKKRDDEFVLEEIAELKAELLEYASVKEEAASAETSRQVAHDIRSPLAALKLVTENLEGVSEEKRQIIRNAVIRIGDIATGLMGRANQNKGPSLVSECLASLVSIIVSEKKAQYKNQPGLVFETEFGSECYRLFALIESREFERVLSNILNNAVEAIESDGKVSVRLKDLGKQVVLEIQDNGCGIPLDHKDQLMKKGATFGKKGGSGLGLYHAKQTLESWQGSLQIESGVGVGTTVSVFLPKASPPSWFLTELKIAPQSEVIVLDDEAEVHDIWNSVLVERFSQYGIRVRHFFSANDFSDFMERPDSNIPRTYLVDYELGQGSKKGVEVLKQFKLQKKGFLVTNQFDSKEVIQECLASSIRLVPKHLVPYIPIRVVQT